MGVGNIGENPLRGCRNLEELDQLLSRYASDIGLPFYSYLLVQAPKERASKATRTLITNYPDEWSERYDRKLYNHYDPVALVSRRSRLPFFWDGGAFLRPFRKDQRRVFYEARSFGIRCGYSLPISAPTGEVGVFSLVGEREDDINDAVQQAGSSVYIAAMQVHDRVLQLSSDGESEKPASEPLQARELECLKWTAEGLTTEAIADNISISPATVNYHLNKAVRKLGASNRHHAAIKAIRAGWI